MLLLPLLALVEYCFGQGMYFCTGSIFCAPVGGQMPLPAPPPQPPIGFPNPVFQPMPMPMPVPGPVPGSVPYPQPLQPSYYYPHNTIPSGWGANGGMPFPWPPNYNTYSPSPHMPPVHPAPMPGSCPCSYGQAALCGIHQPISGYPVHGMTGSIGNLHYQGCVNCPRGPQGPVGAQGPVGPQGSPGVGADGPQGRPASKAFLARWAPWVRLARRDRRALLGHQVRRVNAVAIMGAINRATNQMKRNRLNRQARVWVGKAVMVRSTPTNRLSQQTKELEWITSAKGPCITTRSLLQARVLERSLREGHPILVTPRRVLMGSEGKPAGALHILKQRIPRGRGLGLLERDAHSINDISSYLTGESRVFYEISMFIKISIPCIYMY